LGQVAPIKGGAGRPGGCRKGDPFPRAPASLLLGAAAAPRVRTLALILCPRLSLSSTQDLSIHTPRRGSCDTSAGTGALPPLPGTPHATTALRACKKLRPSLDFGGGGRPHLASHHAAVGRASLDCAAWASGAAPGVSAGGGVATPSSGGTPAPPPVPLSLPSVSLAGLLPDQVEHAIGAAKRSARAGGRGPLGLRLDTAALVRDLNAARGAAAAAVAGRRFSACF